MNSSTSQSVDFHSHFLTGADKPDQTQSTPISQRVDHNSAGFLVKRPLSTATRLIVPFSPINCCGCGSGFTENSLFQYPPQLVDCGIPEEEFRAYLLRMEKIQAAELDGFFTFVLVIMVVTLPFVCYRDRKHQSSIREWQDDINKNLFQPRGLLVKFQTAVVQIDRYHEEISWLAIALTPEEAKLLDSEPVIWRNKCCSRKEIVPDFCSSRMCAYRVV